MLQLLHWLAGVPRKWIALAAMILAAAMNPLFVTLEENAFEQTAAATYRPIDIKLGNNIGAKVAHIRGKGIWVVPGNKLSGLIGSSETREETDEPDEPDVNNNMQWTLVGLISSENGNEAVLRQGTYYVYSVVEGDRLPSGEQVVALGDDYLTLTMDDIEQQLLLYPTAF